MSQASLYQASVPTSTALADNEQVRHFEPDHEIIQQFELFQFQETSIKLVKKQLVRLLIKQRISIYKCRILFKRQTNNQVNLFRLSQQHRQDFLEKQQQFFTMSHLHTSKINTFQEILKDAENYPKSGRYITAYTLLYRIL